MGFFDRPTIDDEIRRWGRSQGGLITSALPLLDHLSGLHPETSPEELVAQVDAAFDRLYRKGRAMFAGHRWLDESPKTVAGFLLQHLAELRYDTATRTWSFTGTPWTVNITVR